MRRAVIIDYGSGNLRSAAKAFERAAAGNSEIVVTSDVLALQSASHIVLPGVGAFDDCMRGLKQTPHMLDMLEEQVIKHRKPFLGICVGMQMLFETSREHGEHKGLGWLKGDVVRIEAGDPSLKIPHMGWNDLTLAQPQHPLLAGIEPGSHAYFVHSYHARAQATDILASVAYGSDLAAIVGRGNIMGTQFHPEKSQETGLKLIGNFLNAV